MNRRKILITGKGSYIGTSLIKWLKQWPDQYEIVELSVRGSEWKVHDFSIYDVVLHVAGIAHVSADPNFEEQYYKVNRDLAIEVANKAKQENVGQFVFMSSIIVYGDSSRVNKQRVIDKKTVPQPTNFYGNSKLLAEQGIKFLEDDKFKVVILRPPMIYGKGSKGNYLKLSRYARRLPIFPNFDNKRSMLHIDNLCEFIRLIINNNERGLFFPQNAEFINTAEMVRLISEAHGEKIRLTKVFNPMVRILGNFVGAINKAFGNLVYEQSMSDYKVDYRIRDLKESIMVTEK